jgi:hypothetical protein
MRDVHVLAVHEIESLYVLPEVFAAIADHQGVAQVDATAKYAEAYEDWKRQAQGAEAARVTYQRFKCRLTLSLSSTANLDLPAESMVDARSAVLEQARLSFAEMNPERVWDAEAEIVNAALLSKDPLDFLRIFPGKALVAVAAKKLGLSRERYCELVKEALGAEEGSALWSLGQSLAMSLTRFLPARVAA